MSTSDSPLDDEEYQKTALEFSIIPPTIAQIRPPTFSNSARINTPSPTFTHSIPEPRLVASIPARRGRADDASDPASSYSSAQKRSLTVSRSPATSPAPSLTPLTPSSAATTKSFQEANSISSSHRTTATTSLASLRHLQNTQHVVPLQPVFSISNLNSTTSSNTRTTTLSTLQLSGQSAMDLNTQPSHHHRLDVDIKTVTESASLSSVLPPPSSPTAINSRITLDEYLKRPLEVEFLHREAVANNVDVILSTGDSMDADAIAAVILGDATLSKSISLMKVGCCLCCCLCFEIIIVLYRRLNQHVGIVEKEILPRDRPACQAAVGSLR